MDSPPGRASLVVNADDYGYFRCVSRGILEAGANGIVTATGVFANAPQLSEQAAWLRDCDALDAGVHLNLTHGAPLTAGLAQRFSRHAGQFPGKFALALAVTSGSIKRDDIRTEWRAQIERCLGAGLRLRFLNSHEHVHIHPRLFRIALELSEEYGIAHVRFPKAGGAPDASAGAFVRSAVTATLSAVNRIRVDAPVAEFLGMEVSGKLDVAYLERTIPRLRAGRVYELMCHPGRFDGAEIRDPRLLGYHRWEDELAALTSASVRELLHRHDVALVGYRHLEFKNRQLVAGAA